MNILFVDDEPAMLRTIRRTLRAVPAHFQIDMESDPGAAIRRLRSKTYDLVVTDLRMPGLGGAEILSATATEHPGAIRAVLTGFAAEREAAPAIRRAHLALAKPFEPDAIVGLVERAASLRAMPLSDDLRRHLGALKTLPPTPHLFASLTSALSDDDRRASVEDIAALLEQDVAMTTKLVQLANSSFFGGHNDVSCLKYAVQRLGTETLSGIVLHYELFTRNQYPAGLEAWRARLNTRALLTSQRAIEIARRHGASAGVRNAAGLAGLLHDIGRLVLALETDEPCRVSYTDSRKYGVELCREEDERFGAHHGWVGAYLLKLWGFSLDIVDAVAWHHHPGGAGQTQATVTTYVHVADALTGPADREPEVDREYLQAIGCLDDLSGWLQPEVSIQ